MCRSSNVTSCSSDARTSDSDLQTFAPPPPLTSHPPLSRSGTSEKLQDRDDKATELKLKAHQRRLLTADLQAFADKHKRYLRLLRAQDAYEPSKLRRTYKPYTSLSTATRPIRAFSLPSKYARARTGADQKRHDTVRRLARLGSRSRLSHEERLKELVRGCRKEHWNYVFTMSTAARRRLMRDFKRMQTDPPAGVSASPIADNVMTW